MKRGFGAKPAISSCGVLQPSSQDRSRGCAAVCGISCDPRYTHRESTFGRGPAPLRRRTLRCCFRFQLLRCPPPGIMAPPVTSLSADQNSPLVVRGSEDWRSPPTAPHCSHRHAGPFLVVPEAVVVVATLAEEAEEEAKEAAEQVVVLVAVVVIIDLPDVDAVGKPRGGGRCGDGREGAVMVNHDDDEETDESDDAGNDHGGDGLSLFRELSTTEVDREAAAGRWYSSSSSVFLSLSPPPPLLQETFLASLPFRGSLRAARRVDGGRISFSETLFLHSLMKWR